MSNLFFEYSGTSGGKEYYEIKNQSSLLTEWQKECGKSWARMTQVVGIPPGYNWYIVEWDVNARVIRYHLRNGHGTSQVASAARVALGPKYLNNDTGETEERQPAPPPRREYAFTCRSQTTGLLWEGVHRGADLIDLVRGEQQLRPDHVIISITYKGDASDA